MSHRNDRHGKALRVVLVLMFGMLAIPFLLSGIWMISYRAAAANADEASQRVQKGQTEAAGEYAELSADFPPRKKEPQANPSIKNGVQPNRPPSTTAIPASPYPSAAGALPPAGMPPKANANAPTLVKESFMLRVPVVDSKTGETSYRQTVVQQYRPVYGLPPFRRAHGTEVAKLLAEIFAAKESGKNVEEQTKELRKRLELEFSHMHKQQFGEIERIEKRLASLKELHDKRESHQDEIVDRRIDQLLGKSDGLQWETATSPFAKGFSPSSVYPPVPLQVAPTYTGPAPYKSPVTSPVPPRTPLGAPAIAPNAIAPNVIAPNPSAAWAQARQSFNRLLTPSYPPVRRPRNPNPSLGIQIPTPVPAALDPPAPVQPAPPVISSRPMKTPSHPGPLARSPQLKIPNGESTLHRNATASSGPKQISDLFELARKIAKTESDLNSYETELEMARAQYKAGKTPVAFILSTERECQRLRGEAELNRAELKAMTDSLRRDVEFAAAAFQLTEQESIRIGRLVQAGAINGIGMVQSKLDRLRAKKALDDANAKLQQLEQAIKLIPKPKSTDEAGEAVPADATEDDFLVPETGQLLSDESSEPAEPDSEN